MKVDGERARAVEAIYSEAERRRRSGDIDESLRGLAATKAITDTLDALGVGYTVTQDFGPSGDFGGFSLRVLG